MRGQSNKYASPIWHPCSQMHDYENFPPIIVQKAVGCYLETSHGKRIIDAISSWWCKTLGHNHPRLKQAAIAQMEKFEHVMLANTTNETIHHLATKLMALAPSLNKVFFASEGSSAVEIALKMSLHTRKIAGENHKTHFVALSNGYHGETTGAMSVSDLGLYCAPYKAMLFKSSFLAPIPYVKNNKDPLWFNCENTWQQLINQLETLAHKTTAIIVEPIIQGAVGMKIYAQDFLKRLSSFCKTNNIHLIADEIMTGLGRTGKMFACAHANILPDFLCLSKNLTGGFIPMSCVMVTDDIYDFFYADYHHGQSFLHSHTFSGNPLAASVAIELLNILEEENLCERAARLGNYMANEMHKIAKNTGSLVNVRHLGAIVAADLISQNNRPRLGFEVFKKAMELGAFLRPLGNTIYWLPPLNTSYATMAELSEITERAILSVIKS